MILAAASCPSDGALGAPRTAQNPLGCDVGRNAGRPQPRWWPSLEPLIKANQDRFPPGVDLAFLGAWIEHESSGRHGLMSRLGEVGYFQLHPAEIEDMAGADQVEAVVDEIQGSKTQDIRWGAALLRRYDAAIVRFGIPRGTRLYHGLLKVMHSSRPRGIRWLQHVQAALGRNPHSYEEFLATTVALSTGAIPARIDKSVPKLPSCSPGYLLDRRAVFLAPGQSGRWPSEVHEGEGLFVRYVVPQAMAAQTAALWSLMGSNFPGVVFGPPLPGVIVASGWGQPRPHRNGSHEGLDLYAPIGTLIRAAADGVADRFTGEFAGRALHIRHAGGWTSRYMHLDEWRVADGQRVRQGDVIGTVGTTGTKFASPHLHFALLLQEHLLPAYAAKFGTPKTGFGRRHGPGVAVPSEPLIPVAGYQADVVRDARVNGIPLHTPDKKPFPWGKAFVGVSATLFVGMVLLTRRA